MAEEVTGALVLAWGTETRSFDGPFTVGRARPGRAAPDVSIDDELASNLHAEFAPCSMGWTVRDLGSTNGTWIGPGFSERVWEWRLLAKGDKVRIGRTALTVVPA